MLRWTAYILFASIAFGACDSANSPGRDPVNPPSDVVNYTEAVPLIDLVHDNGVVDTYFGFEGGLYLGSNEVPAEHAAGGAETARQIQPRDTNGNLDPNGKIVLISIGPSNATQEWCHQHSYGAGSDPACFDWTFQGQAALRTDLNTNLVIVNGADGGQDLSKWEPSTHANYDRIGDTVLPDYGVSEDQVQIVWMKAVLGHQFEELPPLLPDPTANAFQTQVKLEEVLTALIINYPNLKQIWITPRIYSYSTDPSRASPHPWEYESGFGVKWFIQDHITDTTPFISWGPYLYANGDSPNSDGTTWPREYLKDDGIHPSILGQTQVADALINHFISGLYTACWFLEAGSC